MKFIIFYGINFIRHINLSYYSTIYTISYIISKQLVSFKILFLESDFFFQKKKKNINNRERK
jgi:hypothetical protein